MVTIKQPLAAIVGPTATGKSEISLRVASILNGEIISCDSAQVYKGMDIGTAKLHLSERVGPDGSYIPHHLLDIVNPDESFSVADFQKLARTTIENINSRGHLPMLVGGTGLYYQAVVDPYKFVPMPGNEKTRKHFEKLAMEYGNKYLHNELKKVDPEAAKRIHPNNRRRLVRALEVYTLTGKPISEARKYREKKDSIYNLAVVALTMPRQMLYRRIEERVDRLIAQGLVEEVRNLIKHYDYNLPAFQALGYKEIISYLRGEIGFEDAVYLLKRNTRRFAKRQLTWFRRDKRLKWWEIKGKEEINKLSLAIATYISRTININVE
ncbi:MAG: tRNA dimethylallyltransferase [Clostridia bacterium]|nr:tRNA dimethylallyltransferase [Clostridia bacterium]